MPADVFELDPNVRVLPNRIRFVEEIEEGQLGQSVFVCRAQRSFFPRLPDTDYGLFEPNLDRIPVISVSSNREHKEEVVTLRAVASIDILIRVAGGSGVSLHS